MLVFGLWEDRKVLISNPGPSCCGATALTAVPLCRRADLEPDDVNNVKEVGCLTQKLDFVACSSASIPPTDFIKLLTAKCETDPKLSTNAKNSYCFVL